MKTDVFLPIQHRDPLLAAIAAQRPFERGALVDLDDAGHVVGEWRPAIRWRDGRVEIEKPTALSGASPEPPPHDLWGGFHVAEFTHIWYAHPGPKPYAYYRAGEPGERFGPRWHAGVWTGPDEDMICVRPCATDEEAERCLSPSGWSPEEAVQLALVKRAHIDKETP